MLFVIDKAILAQALASKLTDMLQDGLWSGGVVELVFQNSPAHRLWARDGVSVGFVPGSGYLLFHMSLSVNALNLLSLDYPDDLVSLRCYSYYTDLKIVEFTFDAGEFTINDDLDKTNKLSEVSLRVDITV